MFPFPNKVVVGITGGIACGKSTVCKKFADLGWQVVSTDSLVHQLLEDDQEVIGQIVNRWGAPMKDVHGNIDKVQLAHVIFNSSTSALGWKGCYTLLCGKDGCLSFSFLLIANLSWKSRFFLKMILMPFLQKRFRSILLRASRLLGCKRGVWTTMKLSPESMPKCRLKKNRIVPILLS